MSVRSRARATVFAGILGLAPLACDGDPARPDACAVGSGIRGEAFTIQSITTGSPPRTADVTALRGLLTVSLNVGTDMIPQSGAHVELWGDGRLLAAAPVTKAPDRAPADPTFVQAVLTFDSAQLPNGRWALEGLLVAGSGSSGVCPATSVIFRLSQPVTVSNP